MAGLTENQIMRAVFTNIRVRGAAGVFAFHPRNEGEDQRRLAGINSGLGVVSGTPDVIIVKSTRCYALELKTKRGKLSDDQVRVLDLMRAAGCDTGVAYGLDEALAWLEQRGILRGVAHSSIGVKLEERQ
jgi:hypothetical protein